MQASLAARRVAARRCCAGGGRAIALWLLGAVVAPRELALHAGRHPCRSTTAAGARSGGGRSRTSRRLIEDGAGCTPSALRLAAPRRHIFFEASLRQGLTNRLSGFTIRNRIVSMLRVALVELCADREDAVEVRAGKLPCLGHRARQRPARAGAAKARPRRSRASRGTRAGCAGSAATTDTPSGHTWCRVKFDGAVGWARRRSPSPE